MRRRSTHVNKLRLVRPATALILVLSVLPATGVMAQALDDNLVVIDQIGADNSADITQTGIRNGAGRDNLPMIQDGFWNRLTILQSGNDNSIGAQDPGLDQEGRFTTSRVFNEITIDQMSDDNVIGTIEQRALGVVPNGANALEIEQSGGDRNRVETVIQIQREGQAAQSMILRQTGADNVVVRASQFANTVDRDEPNVVRVTLSGNRNGRDRLGGFAARPSLIDSGIVQEVGSADARGNGNFVDLLISGNDNAFGIRQGGRMNSVGLITVSGDFNDLGLRQDGDENDLSMAQIEGDRNSIGVDQMGTNLAEVNLIGPSDDNAVWMRQHTANAAFVIIEGSGNSIEAQQDILRGLGGENEAGIQMFGNDNRVEVVQLGTNLLTVRINGDTNNAAGPLSGSAAALGLTAGLLEQTGFDNRLEAGIIGNGNAIASLQTGDLNTILLKISGDTNEAAFVQMGRRNAAGLFQNGNANRAIFNQN